MPGDTCGKVHVVPAVVDPYALRRVPAEDLVVAFQSTPLPASGKGALQGLDASNEWAFRWPAKKLPYVPHKIRAWMKPSIKDAKCPWANPCVEIQKNSRSMCEILQLATSRKSTLAMEELQPSAWVKRP